MKTQSNVVKPPTLDIAIRKYLIGVTSGAPPYPKGVSSVGRYNLEGQYITVYKYHGKLVFDLGHIQNRGISFELRSILRNLERYLWRTQHLSYDDQIILKYTKYWD